ncbi:hypothetical protein [Desulfitobacterium sp. AusDCA]|uniref:hypothetical protein n=1 Tax=Desulfitobacterium sp. AusDCA TaxID=3240383 RepID=UPI003DA77494
MSIEVKAWKCEKCGKAYLNKYLADNCCKEKPHNTCRVCGKEVDSPWLICHTCKDKERFEKAKKIRLSEYKSWLYDESLEEYFPDKESLEEKYYDNAFDEQGKDPKVEYPEWCYGCVEIPFKINIDSALERAEEDMYEEFDRDRELIDLKELLDFIEVWNAKQTAKAYMTDYSTVVLLNE